MWIFPTLAYNEPEKQVAHIRRLRVNILPAHQLHVEAPKKLSQAAFFFPKPEVTVRDVAGHRVGAWTTNGFPKATKVVFTRYFCGHVVNQNIKTAPALPRQRSEPVNMRISRELARLPGILYFLPARADIGDKVPRVRSPRRS